jgi:glutamate/tyrosine decarboxylase-like PLP-dependent enzyme
MALLGVARCDTLAVRRAITTRVVDFLLRLFGHRPEADGWATTGLWSWMSDEG